MTPKLIIIRAGGSLADPPEIRDMEPIGPDFGEVQKALDMLRGLLDNDDLEHVPLFDTISIDGKREQCVAFCGEHGKIDGKPVNRRATVIWRRSITEHPDHPLMARLARDWLAGTVVVLIGDTKFLETL
jgi:hypothetical protein